MHEIKIIYHVAAHRAPIFEFTHSALVSWEPPTTPPPPRQVRSHKSKSAPRERERLSRPAYNFAKRIRMQKQTGVTIKRLTRRALSPNHPPTHPPCLLLTPRAHSQHFNQHSLSELSRPCAPNFEGDAITHMSLSPRFESYLLARPWSVPN